jgi:hypothetical protein
MYLNCILLVVSVYVSRVAYDPRFHLYVRHHSHSPIPPLLWIHHREYCSEHCSHVFCWCCLFLIYVAVTVAEMLLITLTHQSWRVAPRIRPMERRRRATFFRMLTNLPHGNSLPDRVLRWGVSRPRSLKFSDEEFCGQDLPSATAILFVESLN